MLSKAEVSQLKKQFIKEYQPAFRAVGNNVAAGIGLDSQTGETTIEVRLTNNKLKNILPSDYHGAKVNIEVIGPIVAY